MKANKEFKSEIAVCKNCEKEFHPRYASLGYFCCKKCEGEYKKKQSYKKYLEHPESYNKVCNLRSIKPFILKEQDNKCAICGMPNVWNDKSIVFILDHIDGHASNNKRSNLRLICPNCDSQLDTYKSKNKKSDRIYYHSNHR